MRAASSSSSRVTGTVERARIFQVYQTCFPTSTLVVKAWELEPLSLSQSRKSCNIQQHRLNLKTLCEVKEAIHRRINSSWLHLYEVSKIIMGFLGGSDGKESACQFRGCGLNLLVIKIPWKMKRLPTPLFLPGKSHGQRGLVCLQSMASQRVGHDLVTKQE